MKDKETMMGSHFWESVVLPGIKFSSCFSETQLKLDFNQAPETLRNKKLLGEPLPKKSVKKICTGLPDWLCPPSQKQLDSLERATLEAEVRRLRDFKELRENTLEEDFLLKIAGRRLWRKVEGAKRALKEKGFRVPRELQNSLKTAKCNLFQPKLHPNIRVDKWWALNRLFLELKELLRRKKRKEAEQEEQEEETSGTMKKMLEILGQ